MTDAATPPTVRPARPADVRAIKLLVDAYAGPILLEKTLANLYEDSTEFWVAELDGRVVGCGALHVLWEDLAEIRTVATFPNYASTVSGTPCAPGSSSTPPSSGCAGCSA